MTDSPAKIARQQLYLLYDQLDNNSSSELRVQVAMLAAHIEIGEHLKGIEQSLDVGLTVRSE